MAARVLLAALVLSLMACASRTTRDNDDDSSTTATTSTASNGATTSIASNGATTTGGAAAGAYVLAMSLVFDPDRPFLFDADVTAQRDQITFVLQPLSAADRTTPVGSPLTAGPFPLDAANTYMATMNGLTVPGEANPITGNEVVADVQLVGRELTCGALAGQLVQPAFIDLGGSTFAMAPATVPDAHTNPVINCAGNHAAPL